MQYKIPSDARRSPLSSDELTDETVFLAAEKGLRPCYARLNNFPPTVNKVFGSTPRYLFDEALVVLLLCVPPQHQLLEFLMQRFFTRSQ